MKYRKKPVVIEAWQWNGIESEVPMPEWLLSPAAEFNPDGGIAIKTLEGTMIAQRGDWIIRGVMDEIYPCKPDIFAATYEVVSG